jgi:uncharacterized protein involved in tolerance to divalent cations
MSDIALLHATFPSTDEAEAVARLVVEERLAACANVMASCTSVYRWRDSVETDVETPVLFKPRTARDRIVASRGHAVACTMDRRQHGRRLGYPDTRQQSRFQLDFRPRPTQWSAQVAARSPGGAFAFTRTKVQAP